MQQYLLDVDQECPHCGEKHFSTLYEDYVGYVTVTAQCHACDYRFHLDADNGPIEEATVRTNMRDGVIVYGKPGSNSHTSIVPGSVRGAHLVGKRLKAEGEPGTWCFFLTDEDAVVTHGTPDLSESAEALVDARAYLDRLIVAPTESFETLERSAKAA